MVLGLVREGFDFWERCEEWFGDVFEWKGVEYSREIGLIWSMGKRGVKSGLRETGELFPKKVWNEPKYAKKLI